jgi:hypothetical protein
MKERPTPTIFSVFHFPTNAKMASARGINVDESLQKLFCRLDMSEKAKVKRLFEGFRKRSSVKIFIVNPNRSQNNPSPVLVCIPLSRLRRL